MTNQFATLDTLQHAKQKVVDLGIEFGPKLFVALLIMLVGFFVARWIGEVFHRWLDKLQLEPPVRLLLLRVLRLIVFGLFFILALQNLGVQLLPLIAGLGVAGAGIALAMQGVLGNLVAGLTIIFTRPFRVTEYVAMAGVEGRVEAIVDEQVHVLRVARLDPPPHVEPAHLTGDARWELRAVEVRDRTDAGLSSQ